MPSGAAQSDSSQQMLDAVDAADRVVGSVRRADVFDRKANFRVAHLFLFNERGELLLQRLARRRRRHPACWGSSVAAYVNSGETYAEAIARRAREELGIDIQSLEMLGKASMADEGCTKFITLYSGRCNGPLMVDASHISEVRFLAVADVLRVRETEPWNLTPTFVHLLDHYRNEIA